MALEDLAGYSLRRRLGSGSAGTLWQVRDLATGRNAVLKRIPVTAIQRKEQFHDELQILQRIRHPHIARVLEVRKSASEWLVFSQYVVALSLTKVLSRRGSLPPGEIVTLLSPLADALHYLHRCGLIHGHLSPTNVLIDAEGRPVLTDSALHSLNFSPLNGAAIDPPSTSNDREALSALAIDAGGPAALFPPALFTDTPAHQLAAHLLTLTAPEPILVGDPDDPPLDLYASPLPPATDDDPIEHARTPLDPPPPPSSAPAVPKPPTPEPPTPAQLAPRTKLRRRSFVPKLTRRTPAPHPDPLARLAPNPLTKTHVIHTDETHLIGTTHVESAISWSAPRASGSGVARTPWSAPKKRRGWRRAVELVGGAREWFGRPAYGVLGAVSVGLVVVLGMGLTVRAVLGSSDATVPASDQLPVSVPPTSATSPATATTTTPPRTTPTPARPDTASPSTPRRTGSGRSVGEWISTLRGLDAQRTQAFRTLDVALLDHIYVPGSEPWRSDRDLLASYRKQGIRIRGLQIQIDNTTVTKETPTTVILRTTDHLVAGRAVDATGTSTTLPPGAPTTRLITLTTAPSPAGTMSKRRPPTWRIATITPA